MLYLLFHFCKMLSSPLAPQVLIKVSMKKEYLPAPVLKKLTKEVSRYSFEVYIIYMEVRTIRVAILL